MSIPHFFQVANCEKISDFWRENIELYEWLPNNLDKVTEKIDGISFRTKIEDDQPVYVDKSGKNFALYDLVQSTFPQNLKNKLILCVKKFIWLYKNGLKGYFLRLGLDEKDTYLSFEYVNGRQNLINYKTECLYFNCLVRAGKEVQNFELTAQNLASLWQVFEQSPPPSYHPSRHPLRVEILPTGSKEFDLPEGLGSLPIAPVRQFMTRKNFAEHKTSGTDIEDANLRAAMQTLDAYVTFWQTRLQEITWESVIGDSSEGVVVTGFKDYPKFKLVGDFFLDNLNTENRFGSYFVAMAGMKPPHKGHMKLIREALAKCKKHNSKLHLYLSEALRDKVTLEASREVLGVYLENEDLDSSLLNITLVEGNQNFSAVEEFVRTIREGSTVYFVCGSMDSEKTREIVSYFAKTFPNIYFEVFLVLEEKLLDSSQKFSATQMRSAVKNNNFALFKSFLPDKSVKDADRIWTILRNCYETSQVKTNSSSNYEYNMMPRIRIG